MNSKTTDTQKQTALQAFALRWDPIAESLEVGERADAGFDAGEWSGPEHAKLQEERYEECITAVAADLGLDPKTLRAYLEEANHAEEQGKHARPVGVTPATWEAMSDKEKDRLLARIAKEEREHVLARALAATWNMLGADAEAACREAGERLTNIAAYECILDADRLEMYAGKDAPTVSAIKELRTLNWTQQTARVRKLLGRLV